MRSSHLPHPSNPPPPSPTLPFLTNIPQPSFAPSFTPLPHKFSSVSLTNLPYSPPSLFITLPHYLPSTLPCSLPPSLPSLLIALPHYTPLPVFQFSRPHPRSIPHQCACAPIYEYVNCSVLASINAHSDTCTQFVQLNHHVPHNDIMYM